MDNIDDVESGTNSITNVLIDVSSLSSKSKIVKPLTILTIGDPHFKNNNFDITEKLLVDILTYIDQWQPDLVVCLGDLLHDFEQAKIHQHMRAIKFLKTLATRVATVLLIGNHDRHNPKVFLTNEHFFTGLEGVANLDIVDRGLVKTINRYGNRYKLVFVPYVPTGEFRHAVKIIAGDDLSTVDAVFAHVEVEGVKIKDNIVSIDGDKWTDEDPPLISGHIHERQQFRNIYYVGTPYQVDRGESTTKGLAKVELYPRRKLDISYHLTSIPMYITIKLTTAEAYTYQPDVAGRLEIIISGKSEENKVFRKSSQFKALRKIATVVVNDLPEDPKLYVVSNKSRPNYWDLVNSKLNDDQKVMLANLIRK